MISTKEAEKIVFNSLPILGSEEIGVEDSLNKVLAEDIYAVEDSPRFNNSAMDGFAVCWDDVSCVENARIKIIGESSAGNPFNGSTDKGEGIKISTGAVVPNGFDTIIPIEDCDFDGNFIVVNKVKRNGQHIRIKGEEFNIGDLLISKNKVVHPAVIALLVMQGIKKIRCCKIPKISVITTGSELVKETDLMEGEIRDSNTPMLKSLIQLSGAECIECYSVNDSLKNTIQIIETAEKFANILLVSGGVSVGSHDHVKQAALENGYTELFWRIKQKPGKPMFFAKKDDKLLFGLPGNPVSSLMNYVKYLHAAILKLSGKPISTSIIKAKAVEDITNSADRTNLLRVSLNKNSTDHSFFTLVKQESHMLTSVSNSDGFISVEPMQIIAEGEWTEVYLFPWKA